MTTENDGLISRRAMLVLALALVGCDTEIREPDGDVFGDPAKPNLRTGSWYGSLGGGEVRHDFDAAGHWVFNYEAKEGKKSVAFARVGQEVAFVPPEGGVSRIVVTGLEEAPSRMVLGLTETFQRARSGVMEDFRDVIRWEFDNVPGGLSIAVTEEITNRIGNVDLNLPSTTETKRASGIFQRR